MAKPTESDLVRYYGIYKELILLHQQFNFGKAPRSSEGFTESLCCHLFCLSKAENVKREHDLFDPKTGLKIEVKGTTDQIGSTTINAGSKFDYLYWVSFLLPQDSIVIKKIPYSEFESFAKLHHSEKRSNIVLKKFVPIERSIFFVSQEKQKFVPQTIAEQLEHIKKYVG